jgi:plastocyanin
MRNRATCGGAVNVGSTTSILKLLTLVALFAALTFQSETESAELYGVNLRKPAQTQPKAKVNRYRTAKKVDADPNCQCNPGLYSVVYLTGDNLPELKAPTAAAKMAQKDMMFEPSVLAVSVGSEVSFPNLDPFFHNVFSYSKTKKFDLGRYPNGETSLVTFDKPGLVKVFCEIHASMRSYVHVLETPYFAVSDDKGRFHIPNVLPGEYTLHLWQENLTEHTQQITISADSAYVEIEP